MYSDGAMTNSTNRNINVYYNKTAVGASNLVNLNLTLNATQSAVDTLCALVSKNKPKPQFLTDGEKDYAVKVRGKKLTKYMEGLFDKLKIYNKTQKVFNDACIYGTGALKLFVREGEIVAEPLFIEEVLVDDLDGLHQEPTQMHQLKYVQRDLLIAQFPEYIEKIKGAQSAIGAATYASAQLIPVRESWHLRSGKKSKDGLHIISIDNCDLFAEEYTRDCYPILILRFKDAPIGYFGTGLLAETWKLQRELDIVLQTIQRSQRLVSGPMIAVEAGSEIVEADLISNKLGKIVQYTNTPPQFLTPPAVNPELYEYAQYLEDRIYKISGVSQAMANGNKPPELKSGVAIRETTDIAAGRFELLGQKWEDFHLDISVHFVELSKEIQATNPDYAVITSSKGSASKIKFKEVDTDIDECKLQVFPVSGLPKTPAGRLDMLMDFASAGYLSKEQVMDVVDFPDLEDVSSLETAVYNLAQERISEIKLNGKYKTPGPYLATQEVYRLACLEVDRAELQNVEKENQELLMRWTSEIGALLTQSQSQQQAMQPQAQGNAGTPSQQNPSVGAAMQQTMQSPT
jgi:hypothetical protein